MEQAGEHLRIGRLGPLRLVEELRHRGDQSGDGGARRLLAAFGASDSIGHHGEGGESFCVQDAVPLGVDAGGVHGDPSSQRAHEEMIGILQAGLPGMGQAIRVDIGELGAVGLGHEADRR